MQGERRSYFGVGGGESSSMREYVMKSPDNDFCLDKGICIQYANLNEQKDKVDGWVNCSIFSNEQKIRQKTT